MTKTEPLHIFKLLYFPHVSKRMCQSQLDRASVILQCIVASCDMNIASPNIALIIIWQNIVQPYLFSCHIQLSVAIISEPRYRFVSL